MSKYIDADILKIEIKHHIELMENEPTNYAKARIDEANETLSVIDALAPEYKSIDSLQQEQPEVDLEKEMDNNYDSPLWEGETVSWMTYTRIARHFYELARQKYEK